MDEDSLYDRVRLSPTGSSDPGSPNRSSPEESDEETFKKQVYCAGDTTDSDTGDEPPLLLPSESMASHRAKSNEAVRSTTSDSSLERHVRPRHLPENDRGQTELKTAHRTCIHSDNQRSHSWHGHSRCETTNNLKNYHTGVPLQRITTLTDISQVMSTGKLAHLLKGYYDIHHCAFGAVDQTSSASSRSDIQSTPSPTPTTPYGTSTTPSKSGTRVEMGTFDLTDRHMHRHSRISNNRCTVFRTVPLPNEQPAKNCPIRSNGVYRIRVFVTYISDEHINDVKHLVSILCRAGVIVDFDKSPECFAVQRLNMHDWLDGCYKKADWIIVCISSTYSREVEEPEEGVCPGVSQLNARYIFNKLRTELWEDQCMARRLIPVLLSNSGATREDVPACMKSTFTYEFPDQMDYIIDTIFSRGRYIPH